MNGAAHAPALHASRSPQQANIYTLGRQNDARFCYAVWLPASELRPTHGRSMSGVLKGRRLGVKDAHIFVEKASGARHDRPVLDKTH